MLRDSLTPLRGREARGDTGSFPYMRPDVQGTIMVEMVLMMIRFFRIDTTHDTVSLICMTI